MSNKIEKSKQFQFDGGKRKHAGLIHGAAACTLYISFGRISLQTCILELHYK